MDAALHLVACAIAYKNIRFVLNHQNNTPEQLCGRTNTLCENGSEKALAAGYTPPAPEDATLFRQESERRRERGKQETRRKKAAGKEKTRQEKLPPNTT